MAARGVVLVRCPERERADLAAKLTTFIASHGQALRSSFVVITPDKARFSKLPNMAG